MSCFYGIAGGLLPDKQTKLLKSTEQSSRAYKTPRKLAVSINKIYLKIGRGTSLAVQWLRLRASTAGGPGLIPGGGTKISQAARGVDKNIK